MSRCNIMENNKAKLLAKLNEHNLQFREDSDLYKQYINGDRKDLDFIISTMIEMDFYMQFTMYKQILKKEKMEAKYKANTWTDENEEVVRQSAKHKAAKNYIFQNKKNNEALDKIPLSIKKKFKL